MNSTLHHLILADDDIDDCDFFREALEELEISAALSIVHDGVQLMEFLYNPENKIPNILFLDINMPRKCGHECLMEIKANDKLKQLPIIMISTSLDMEMVHLLQQHGARHYIRKPNEFSKLKSLIYKALTLLSEDAGKTDFILQP